MKKLFSIAALFASLTAYAQDVITTKSGNDFTVNIISIDQSSVSYRLYGSPDSTIKTMPKSDVFRITHANGMKQNFAEAETSINDFSEMRLKAELDAESNYKGYRGARTATLVTTIAVGPILGLIPAIACSSTAPDIKRLNYPNSSLMKNAEYKYAYEEKAKRIKSKKLGLLTASELGFV